MEAYYQQQSVSQYFSGHYRQRGSGFWALSAGIVRASLPIARKFFFPVAEKIVTEKYSPKQAKKRLCKKL